METSFLLFNDYIINGRRECNFIGRTVNKTEAKNHYNKCKENPYSTGQVWIVNEYIFKEYGLYFMVADENTNWDNF